MDYGSRPGPGYSSSSSVWLRIPIDSRWISRVPAVLESLLAQDVVASPECRPPLLPGLFRLRAQLAKSRQERVEAACDAGQRRCPLLVEFAQYVGVSRLHRFAAHAAFSPGLRGCGAAACAPAAKRRHADSGPVQGPPMPRRWIFRPIGWIVTETFHEVVDSTNSSSLRLRARRRAGGRRSLPDRRPWASHENTTYCRFDEVKIRRCSAADEPRPPGTCITTLVVPMG